MIEGTRRILSLVACATIMLASGACGASVSTSGPLHLEQDGEYGLQVDAGQDLVISLPPIDNKGAKPITIDSVRLLIADNAPARIIVKQELIGLPSRVNTGGALRGPLDMQSEGPWEPVAGAVIQPANIADTNGNQGYAFMFVVTLNGPGMGWATGVETDYHLGSQKYRATSDDLFAICAPVDEDHQCDPDTVSTASS